MANADFTELTAALAEMDSEDRKETIDWLRDGAAEAVYDEPSVGIFANPRMAHFFTTVACLIEQVSA